jgi:hypothetical protein
MHGLNLEMQTCPLAPPWILFILEVKLFEKLDRIKLRAPLSHLVWLWLYQEDLISFKSSGSTSGVQLH